MRERNNDLCCSASILVRIAATPGETHLADVTPGEMEKIMEHSYGT